MKALPIHNRTREVIAYALVDDADFARVSQFSWCLGTKGYVIRTDRSGPSKVTVRLHRELLGLLPGERGQADHVNRNKLDNRRRNLRVLTPAQNNENVPSRGGTSSFRGVSLAAGKWRAYARKDGRLHHLGVFVHELDAARAAQAFRLTHMPHSTEVAL